MRPRHLSIRFGPQRPGQHVSGYAQYSEKSQNAWYFNVAVSATGQLVELTGRVVPQNFEIVVDAVSESGESTSWPLQFISLGPRLLMAHVEPGHTPTPPPCKG